MKTRRLAIAGVRPLLLVVLSVLPAGAVAADRLVLEGGGSIVVERWWSEGDWVRYESQGGTIGLPRSTVVRIDRDIDPAAAAPATPAPRTRRPRPSPVETDEIVARVREGHAALERRDFDAASSIYYRVLLEEPRITPARVGHVVAEMALGRDGVAFSAVREGLELDPDEPRLLELLGDLHDRDDRVEDALEAWKAAFELKASDRVREKIFKGERERRASGAYDFAATPHFNFRYDGDVDMELAAEVMDYLEEQYWVLAERLDHAPPQPITVLLYPRREFRAVTRAAEGVGGVFDGKIRVPLGGLRRLDDPARRVLVHELTHAVVHSKTRANCPRWLHEGMAQLLDGTRPSDSDRREVRELLADNAAPSWDIEGFSYPAALSLTRYLESLRGFDALVDVLDRLADGEDIDTALERLYGERYDALRQRWTRTALRRAGR